MEKTEILEQIKNDIQKLSTKDFNIYFFTMDTKGSPTAGVANVYEHVKVLNELGYNAHILHEKNDYTKVGKWLGEGYDNLSHVSIEGGDLKVSSTDFVVVPEIFANVLEQIKGLPCKKVVMSQAYDYIFEMLEPGKNWCDYNVFDVITTSETQKEYINGLFNNPKLEVGVTDISLPNYFTKSNEPKKPVVTIFTREQRDTAKLFKAFYVKYPHLKWVSFRDLRGLPRETFAKQLSEACVSVWVDDISGFGTFPLESMKCGVPVIGKVPNLVPEWITDKNGMWTNNFNTIVDILGNYVQAWLEDLEPQEIYTEMDETVTKYTEENQKNSIETYFTDLTKKYVTILEKELKTREESITTELNNETTNG
jgi:hypothetical protein